MAKRLTMKQTGTRPGHAAPGRRGNRPLRSLKPTHRPGPKTQPPLTSLINDPSEVHKEIGAATRLKYGASERDIRQQYKANTAQQRHAQDWYSQYLDVVGKARADSAAANAQGQAYLSSQGQSLAGLDASTGQTQLAAMKADAARRGATVDPSMASTIQNASAARQAGLGNYQGLAGTLGTNQQDYLSGTQVAGGASRLRTALDLMNARKDITTKRSQLRSDEGDFKTTYRSALRDSERAWLDKLRGFKLEKAAFGLNQDKAAETGRHNKQTERERRQEQRRQNMEDDRGYRLDKAKFGAAKAKERYQRRNGLGAYKPPSTGSGSSNPRFPHLATDAKETEIVSKIRTTASKIRHARTAKNYTSTRYRALLADEGVDADIINAAFDVAYLNGLSPANIHALHSTYHVQLGPHFKLLTGKQAKRRRTATKTTAPVTNAVGSLTGSVGNLKL